MNYKFYLSGVVDSVDTELATSYMFYPIVSKKPMKLQRTAVALTMFNFQAYVFRRNTIYHRIKFVHNLQEVF